MGTFFGHSLRLNTNIFSLDLTLIYYKESFIFARALYSSVFKHKKEESCKIWTKSNSLKTKVVCLCYIPSKNCGCIAMYSFTYSTPYMFSKININDSSVLLHFRVSDLNFKENSTILKDLKRHNFSYIS